MLKFCSRWADSRGADVSPVQRLDDGRLEKFKLIATRRVEVIPQNDKGNLAVSTATPWRSLPKLSRDLISPIRQRKLRRQFAHTLAHIGERIQILNVQQG